MTGPTRSTYRQTVIRASSLPDAQDCARRWAARNLQEELSLRGFIFNRHATGIAAAIGTSVHKGAAVSLEEKIHTGEISREDDAMDAAMDALKEEVHKGVSYDEETTNLASATQQVRRMTLAFRLYAAPKIQPVMVERRLEAEAREGLLVSGQADTIAQEPDSVDDLKTGKQRGNFKAQFGIYSLLKRSHGAAVNVIREIFVPRVALSRAQPMPQFHEHSVETCETAADAVLTHLHTSMTTFRQGAGRIAAGDPWAFVANPSSKLCNPRFCPAWGTPWCREHKED